MNILHISGSGSWGGNEQQLIYLMNELPKYDVKQKIFCFKDTPLFRAASKCPIEIISLETVSPYSLKYRNFLSRIVKEHEIDVLHLHTSNAVTGYVFTDLLSPLKTPALYARKSIRRKNGLLSKLKYNYKNIDKISCISQYVARHFKKVLLKKNYKKLALIYNGVRVEDISKEAPFKLREKFNISPSTFLLGNIANHTKAKDLATFIKTIHELVYVHNFKNIKVVQIGGFSKRTRKFKEMLKEYKLEPYIEMMGFMEKASAFLPQFDLFLMTSEREGGPSSIVESFYHKTPVISTKVGVVEEVIEDGVNGFSTNVGDYQELSKKILEFREKPELEKQFKEKSYEIFLKRFTAQQLGENTYLLYKELKNSRA